MSLSNKQLKEIKILYFFYENFINLLSEYKKSISKYIKFYYSSQFTLIKNLLKVVFDYNLNNEEVPLELPVTSGHIISMGYKGKDISIIKKNTEEYWIKNNCELNNEYLIKYIKNINNIK